MQDIVQVEVAKPYGLVSLDWSTLQVVLTCRHHHTCSK